MKECYKEEEGQELTTKTVLHWLVAFVGLCIVWWVRVVAVAHLRGVGVEVLLGLVCDTAHLLVGYLVVGHCAV